MQQGGSRGKDVARQEQAGFEGLEMDPPRRHGFCRRLFRLAGERPRNFQCVAQSARDPRQAGRREVKNRRTATHFSSFPTTTPCGRRLNRPESDRRSTNSVRASLRRVTTRETRSLPSLPNGFLSTSSAKPRRISHTPSYKLPTRSPNPEKNFPEKRVRRSTRSARTCLRLHVFARELGGRLVSSVWRTASVWLDGVAPRPAISTSQHRP